MNQSIRTGAVAVSLAALVVASAGAAYANHTSVSVNGNTTRGHVHFEADNLTPEIAFMTNYGAEMNCGAAWIASDTNYLGPQSIIERGETVNPSETVGMIGLLSFSDCAMSVFELNVTMAGGNVTVRNHPVAAGSPVDVTIEDIHADIEATSGGICTFEADGTLNALITPGGGSPDATLELVSADFGPPETGFDLTISNVVGCGGEVVNGDLAGAWDSDAVNGTPSIFSIDTIGPGAGPITHG